MRVIVVGEGMVELSRAGDAWRAGYGGDTLNTAVHLARLGRCVAFATALGMDSFSLELRAACLAEGLDTSLILDDPERSCGLYAIHTDPNGERAFQYWRGQSAARGMFDLPGSAAWAASIEQADLLYFSAITMAILPVAGRMRLLDVAGSVRRRGGRVAFDGNYRPRLWRDPAEAQYYRDAAIAVADIGLPTFDDEQALSGFADADAVARHWQRLGAIETVVKLGAQGCRLPDGDVVSPPVILQPVDTSGAGDAFNAGYLHAWMSDAPPAEAALNGHRLAGWVVGRRSALPPHAGSIYQDLRNDLESPKSVSNEA